MTDPETGSHLLDAALIRHRRLSLGITEREIARQLGVTAVVVHGLERSLNHADLPAGLVVALARALALDIDALFQQAVRSPEARPGEMRAGRGLDENPSQAAAAVGALLHAAGRGVPVSVLAETTGWPLERVTDALDALAAMLPSVGLRLHRFGEDQVRITAAASAPDTLQGLLRSSTARTGMNLRQAQMAVPGVARTSDRCRTVQRRPSRARRTHQRRTGHLRRTRSRATTKAV